MIMQLETYYQQLTVTDGSLMRAYIARPKYLATQKGILLFQEIFGVNSHIRDIAERFAQENFIVIAPELFHRSTPGFEAGYNEFPKAYEQAQLMNDRGIELDIQAAYTELLTKFDNSNCEISSVGFCMGGTVAFRAGLMLPLKHVVSFYGGGIAKSANARGLIDQIPNLKASVLLFWSGHDQWITLENTRSIVDALRQAGKTYINVEFSDAEHGFFCDARPSYNEKAAKQAWDLVLNYLK